MKARLLTPLALIGAGLAAAAAQELPSARPDPGLPAEFIELPNNVNIVDDDTEPFSLIRNRSRATADALELLQGHTLATAPPALAAPGARFTAEGQLQFGDSTAPIRIGENGLWFSRVNNEALMLRIEQRDGAYVALTAVTRNGRVTEQPAAPLRLNAANRINVPGGFRITLTPTVSGGQP